MVKIKCAAWRLDRGKIPDTFPGKNHGEAYQEMQTELSKYLKAGFLTTKGEFIDRKEAAKIAFEAGQIKKKISALISEDLIADDPEYCK
jgi:hypothetical protein